MKKFLIIAVILLLAGLAVFFYHTTRKAKAPSNDTLQTQSPPPSPTPTNTPLEWELVPSGEDPITMAPITRVSLIAGGKVYDTGTHTGSCSIIEQTSWQLLIGERTGVICWWAGAGTEIGVFEAGGKLVLRRGVLEEGSDDAPGTRGNFTQLQEL